MPDAPDPPGDHDQEDVVGTFHNPLPTSHDHALKVFASGDPAAISTTLVAHALHDDDAIWVEEQCWQLAEHPDPWVRGTAGLCLGHVGRRFGRVQPRSWGIVTRLCADPIVDNRPCDALDDLRHFAGPQPPDAASTDG